MVNGEVCVGLFAIRDIKKVMLSAERDDSFICLVKLYLFHACVYVLRKSGRENDGICYDASSFS